MYATFFIIQIISQVFLNIFFIEWPINRYLTVFKMFKNEQFFDALWQNFGLDILACLSLWISVYPLWSPCQFFLTTEDTELHGGITEVIKQKTTW